MVRFVMLWLAALAAFGGLAGVAGPLDTPNARRSNAEVRWAAQGIADYRLLVQVEQAFGTCLQEIEVYHDSAPALIRDTCSPTWLSRLTVRRLFEISQRLERASDCYPSSGSCVCQRQRIGDVRYDPGTGFPQMIEWRRELRPNWQHGDFWRRLFEIRELPRCQLATQQTRITVLSLTPLAA